MRVGNRNKRGGKENLAFDNSIQVGNLFGKLNMNQS